MLLNNNVNNVENTGNPNNPMSTNPTTITAKKAVLIAITTQQKIEAPPPTIQSNPAMAVEKKSQQNQLNLPTIRFELAINEPSQETFSEFNYNKLALKTLKQLKRKSDKVKSQKSNNENGGNVSNKFVSLTNKDCGKLDKNGELRVEKVNIRRLLSIYRKKLILSRKLDTCGQDEDLNESLTTQLGPEGELDELSDEDDDSAMSSEEELAKKQITNSSKKKLRKKVCEMDMYKYKLKNFANLGTGYDESDSFIDNSDAHDVNIPKNMVPTRGGFYINGETLTLRPKSDVKKSKQQAQSAGGGAAAAAAAAKKRQSTKQDSKAAAADSEETSGQNSLTNDSKKEEDEEREASSDSESNSSSSSSGSSDSDGSDSSGSSSTSSDSSDSETSDDEKEKEEVTAKKVVGNESVEEIMIIDSIQNGTENSNASLEVKKKKRIKRNAVEDGDENEESVEAKKDNKENHIKTTGANLVTNNLDKEKSGIFEAESREINSNAKKRKVEMPQNESSNALKTVSASTNDILVPKKKKLEPQSDYTSNVAPMPKQQQQQQQQQHQQKQQPTKQVHSMTNGPLTKEIKSEQQQQPSNATTNQRPVRVMNVVEEEESGSSATTSSNDCIEIDNKDEVKILGSVAGTVSLAQNLPNELKTLVNKFVEIYEKRANSTYVGELWNDEIKENLLKIFMETSKGTDRTNVFQFISSRCNKSKDTLFRICRRLNKKKATTTNVPPNNQHSSTTKTTTTTTTAITPSSSNPSMTQVAKSNKPQTPSTPSHSLTLDDLNDEMRSKFNQLRTDYTSFHKQTTQQSPSLSPESIMTHFMELPSTGTIIWSLDALARNTGQQIRYKDLYFVLLGELFEINRSNPQQREMLMRKYSQCVSQCRQRHYENILKTKIADLKKNIDAEMPKNMEKFNKAMEEYNKQKDQPQNLQEAADKTKNPPRKRFEMNEHVRQIILQIIQNKMALYKPPPPQQQQQPQQSDLALKSIYINQFFEAELIPLWPKNWMQKSVLNSLYNIKYCNQQVSQMNSPSPNSSLSQQFQNKTPVTQTPTQTQTATSAQSSQNRTSSVTSSQSLQNRPSPNVPSQNKQQQNTSAPIANSLPNKQMSINIQQSQNKPQSSISPLNTQQNQKVEPVNISSKSGKSVQIERISIQATNVVSRNQPQPLQNQIQQQQQQQQQVKQNVFDQVIDQHKKKSLPSYQHQQNQQHQQQQQNYSNILKTPENQHQTFPKKTSSSSSNIMSQQHSSTTSKQPMPQTNQQIQQFLANPNNFPSLSNVSDYAKFDLTALPYLINNSLNKSSNFSPSSSKNS